MTLDPCPFCGHAEPVLDGADEHCRVRCLGCDAKGKTAYISDYLTQAGGDEDAAADLAEVAAINAWNNRAAPALPEYLVVYEHRHGTDIYRVRSEQLGAHLGWNSFEEHQDDPVILALCKVLGLTFEPDEIINIFDMPETKGVFTYMGYT